MNKDRRNIIALCTAAASLSPVSVPKQIGPDLDIRPGEVGEIIISSIIQDEAKCGFTAVVHGGGILSLRLTPEGQKNCRTKEHLGLTKVQRAKILHILETWPEQAPDSLRRYAATMGVPLIELKKACFANPGRAKPPLRDAYELAHLRWKRVYNERRGRRA